MLGPIPVWALLFGLPHFVFDRPRRVKAPVLAGLALVLLAYPAIFSLCALTALSCRQAGPAADFLVMTGDLFLGWSLSVAVTRPLNRWHQRRWAARRARDGR